MRLLTSLTLSLFSLTILAAPLTLDTRGITTSKVPVLPIDTRGITTSKVGLIPSDKRGITTSKVGKILNDRRGVMTSKVEGMPKDDGVRRARG